MVGGSRAVRFLWVFLLFLVGVGVGCSSATNTPLSEAAAGSTSTDETDPREVLEVPLSLYVLVEAGAPTSPLSSTRTTEDLDLIAANMGTIWAQADIAFAPVSTSVLEVPGDALAAIARGLDPEPLLAAAGRDFEVPTPGLLNGFYVNEAAGVNGFAPSGRRVFFVVDEPSVHDERVSSHEVGHIFGLHHDLTSPGRLLFSGTNGTELTPEQQTVARYSAQGILDATR